MACEASSWRQVSNRTAMHRRRAYTCELAQTTSLRKGYVRQTLSLVAKQSFAVQESVCSHDIEGKSVSRKRKSARSVTDGGCHWPQ